MKRFLLALFALTLLTCSADAAARFAVCTTACTWDASNTSMWSTSSGGATGASVPGASDTVTLDAATCVGGTTCTITVNTNVNITSLTFGACTASTSGCILDFSVNNNNVTISTTLSGAGTGTRTLRMGNGVWTFGGVSSSQWNFTTTTSLTLTINSSSIVWVGGTSGATSFFGGGLTWGALTISANPSFPSTFYRIEPGNTANNTFASLTVNAPAVVQIRAGATQTFTGGITVSGSSSSNWVTFLTDGVSNSTGTIAVGATSNVAYTAWLAIAGATNAINATNSVNLGATSGGVGTLSITPPSSGGVAPVIGG